MPREMTVDEALFYYRHFAWEGQTLVLWRHVWTSTVCASLDDLKPSVTGCHESELEPSFSTALSMLARLRRLLQTGCLSIEIDVAVYKKEGLEIARPALLSYGSWTLSHGSGIAPIACF